MTTNPRLHKSLSMGLSMGRRGARAASGAAVGLALVLTGLPAAAQKTYRCGSVYQDRPCDANQESRVVNRSGAGVADIKPVVDGECARLGEQAQKIMWVREAGQTERDQVVARPGEKALIAEVYRRQGSSLEVRKSMEAECVADKARAAQAAAMAEAAAQMQKSTTSQVAPARAPNGTSAVR